MHAASVTDPEDLQLYMRLAEEWIREADRLEQGGDLNPPAPAGGRRSRP